VRIRKFMNGYCGVDAAFVMKCRTSRRHGPSYKPGIGVDAPANEVIFGSMARPSANKNEA